MLWRPLRGRLLRSFTTPTTPRTTVHRWPSTFEMFNSFCSTPRSLMTVTFCNAADITAALHAYTTMTRRRIAAIQQHWHRSPAVGYRYRLITYVHNTRAEGAGSCMRKLHVAVTRRAVRHCRQPRQTASMYYQLTVRQRSTLYVSALQVSQSEPRPWPRRATVLL